jgi:alpha-glucosidase
LTAETASEEQPYCAEALRKTLDPFYKQHVVADGLVIAGSEKVSMYALREVAYLARKVLANRPDVMKNLCEKRQMFVAVMAYNEMQTDLPDCRGMSLWWAYRARGLGSRPVSCGEENVLCFQGDPWQGENIFIHEFAHGIHGVIADIDKPFIARLTALSDEAKRSGRFRGYAIEGGPSEFWAEGVQAWFNCNGTIRPKSGGGQSSFEVLGPQGEHVCHIATREQVKAHLPEYAKLLDESFRQNEWVYVPVAKRMDEPHLRGFDPAKAPVFRWPPEVIEAYNREEAEKAKTQEQHK